jgi:hypothetical protein
MRHPFAEILAAQNVDDAQEPKAMDCPSRRSAMGWVLSLLASAVGLVGGGRQAWAQTPAEDAPASSEEKPPKDVGTGKSAKGFSLYLVVPKSIRKFTTKRRTELGVGGPYVHGWGGNENWKQSKGFLAWVSEEEAKKIREAADVHAVNAIKAEDKIKTGHPSKSGGKLTVAVMPNGWPHRPEADNYFSAKQLADSWAKQFSDAKHVKFTPSENAVEVNFGKAKIDERMIDVMAANPQVSQLAWSGPPTTKAIGEEGGQTTLARWEEGGPSTRRLGEEGGRPPRPTTLAVGEEGGVTTLALGEEGGRPIPRPLPRPLPRPGITTKAIGEEGGVRPKIVPVD